MAFIPKRFSLWRGVGILYLGLFGVSFVRAADLSTLPTDTWVNATPTYTGAPNGGQIFPMGWNNKGTYDPNTQRVIVMDRWYDSVHSQDIYANAVMAYDPAS